MRIPFRFLMTMSLAAQALAMTPQYSSYVNYSIDASHIYATAVVDGSTSCDPNCPLGAMHTGKVYLHLGSTGGWVNGNTVTPPTYLSVSNSQTINATPGVNYAESDEEEVYCSGLGSNIFQEGGGPLLKLTTTYWGPPVTEQNNKCYWGSLACSAGTTATCKGGTAIAFVPSCPQYVKATWLVVGGVCTVFVGAAATGPGACD